MSTTAIKIDKKITSWNVIKAEKEKPVKVKKEEERRPKELNCDIHQAKVKGESWTIFVGLKDGKPYEVFGGLSKFIEIPKKLKSGNIIRNGKKDGITTYNLTYGEEGNFTTVKDIINTFENLNHGALTRMISLLLRSNVDTHFICEQLVKDPGSDLFSFSRVLARVLKNYIPDGTKSGEKVCQSCGKENSMVYQEGCMKCLACNYSKCS